MLLVRAFLLFNCSANAFFSSSEVAEVNKVVGCCQSFFFSAASPFSFLVQVFLLFWCQPFFFSGARPFSSFLLPAFLLFWCQPFFSFLVPVIFLLFWCQSFFFSGASLSSLLSAKIFWLQKNWLQKYFVCKNILAAKIIWLQKYFGCENNLAAKI